MDVMTVVLRSCVCSDGRSWSCCARNHPWLDISELSELLAARAVELGSVDNVTVVIADVRRQP